MLLAFSLLLIIGVLGSCDVLVFHIGRCDLATRPESQREVLLHTLRHLIYGLQFLFVAQLRAQGWALLGVAALYLADVAIALLDVWEEPASRESQGGLPRGEYLMHVVLSVLVGAYLLSIWQAVWPLRLLPTALVWSPLDVPAPLRWLMSAMAVSAFGFFLHDLRGWLRRRQPRAPRLPKANKIVVEALIPAPREEVWRRSQDPAEHVRWDIRFDGIRLLNEQDAAGRQRLLYTTRLVWGLRVEGHGHFLANSPLERSVFGFDSADPRSLIRDGRGLWLYEQRGDQTLFKTVFDYQVRFGLLGKCADRMFRPLMQLATEWSFETLRQACAGDEHAISRRRSRLGFLLFFCARLCGRPPASGAAHSWLGRGHPRESPFPRTPGLVLS